MDISKIYSLRKNFTVIAVTGRTGSGCTEVTEALSKGYYQDPELYPLPNTKEYDHNSQRKYRIIHEFAINNFSPYQSILYKDILIAFILSCSIEELINYLKSPVLQNEFTNSGLLTECNFDKEIIEINKLKESFGELHKEASELIRPTDETKDKPELERLYNFFFSENFKQFSSQLHNALMIDSLIKRNKSLQIIANNIRSSGHPYTHYNCCDLEHIFTIAEIINDLIKAIRSHNNDREQNTKIAIDSLRNPLEIMFFRQRFSAFYTLAVNREDSERKEALLKRLKVEQNEESDLWKDMKILLEEEYENYNTREFFKQDVSKCIQCADIHLNFMSLENALESNAKKDDNTSPFFSWGMQLLKFTSLIDHPGLITPSPEERCMQLAYTAKYNSGCISRQVGAAITDENYSLKAIGWNNTPEGHVPCALRNVEHLLKGDLDQNAFTNYEKGNVVFKEKTKEFYNHLDDKKGVLHGQNVSYCFKSIINSIKEGKNQVHTRSLHAEESAFLQIAKYGGTGIKGGKLFTTASPCELCAKKAYQLGITCIYYIDPYPGISYSHILKNGNNSPKVRLFWGAIGNAYHWLYESVMPYKDELELILDLDIKDKTKILEESNITLIREKAALQNEIEKLKKQFGVY